MAALPSIFDVSLNVLIDHVTGIMITKQQAMSTNTKIVNQNPKFLADGPCSVSIMYAIFTRTCRGMPIISSLFSLSCKKGFKNDQPVPTRTMTVNNNSARIDLKMKNKASQARGVPVIFTWYLSSASKIKFKDFMRSKTLIKMWILWTNVLFL